MSTSSSKAKVLALLEELKAQVEILPEDIFQADEARRRAMMKTVELTRDLESPMDGVHRIWFQPQLQIATQIALDGRWLDTLDDGKPRTASELAAITGAERELIVRVFRVLTSTGVAIETSVETYRSTALSKILSTAAIRAGVKHFLDHVSKVLVQLPDYLRQTSYRVPQEPSTGPFANAYGGRDFWDLLREEPERAKMFNSYMTIHKEGRANWLDTYSVENLAGQDLQADKDAVLLVDIGGNRGHDLKAFNARRGGMQGRLILQDQPWVVSDIDPQWEEEGIEPMAHDFFTPQPVKDARAYYFRSIFRDWSDLYARRILHNIIPAMKKGYSKVLINDMVLPDRNAPMFSAYMDLTMMTVLGSGERTSKQWHELLGSVGLGIEKIYLGEGTESVIEATLKE